jgi:hypothetical protein
MLLILSEITAYSLRFLYVASHNTVDEDNGNAELAISQREPTQFSQATSVVEEVG